MKREKTRQKKPSRDNSISDPDIYEVVPFVEITRIVVPERPGTRFLERRRISTPNAANYGILRQNNRT